MSHISFQSAWIQRQPTAKEWLHLLSYIPWKYDLPHTLGESVGIQFLAQFCSAEWLTSLHIDQMAAVLDHRLMAEFNGSKCFVGTEWSDKLQSFFHSWRGEYLDSPSTQGLHHLAGEIVAGNLLKIATILPVFLPDEQTTVLLNPSQPRGIHWVALLLDLDQGVVRYGDPASASMPIDLVKMVQWWLDQHHWSKPMEIDPLPCTKQSDMYSCSTLVLESLLYHLYLAIQPTSLTLDGAPSQFRALELVCHYIQEQMVSLY
jgi:hypothetical protein